MIRRLLISVLLVVSYASVTADSFTIKHTSDGTAVKIPGAHKTEEQILSDIKATHAVLKLPDAISALNGLILYGPRFKTTFAPDKELLQGIEETFKGDSFQYHHGVSDFNKLWVGGIRNVGYLYLYYLRFDRTLTMFEVPEECKVFYLNIYNSPAGTYTPRAYGTNSTEKINLPLSWRNLKKIRYFYFNNEKLSASQVIQFVTDLEERNQGGTGFASEAASATVYVRFDSAGVNANAPVAEADMLALGYTKVNTYYKKVIHSKTWYVYVRTI